MSLAGFLLVPMLAAAPYALIETRDIDQTDSNNFQVSVRQVDGKAYFGVREDMMLTPDVHWVVLTAEYAGTKVQNKNYEKSYYLLAKPCTRYRVSGQVENALSGDWKIRVLGEERILSCKTKEEAEKEKAERKAMRDKLKQESKKP